eukprot:40788-Prorocentrum_minimum.AAC.1
MILAFVFPASTANPGPNRRVPNNWTRAPAQQNLATRVWLNGLIFTMVFTGHDVSSAKDLPLLNALSKSRTYVLGIPFE